MTTYNVIIESDQETSSVSWMGDGGTTSGSAFELSPGDVVNFKKQGLGSPVVSGFDSNFWTNSSNITLNFSNQSKTVASGTVNSVDGLTATANSSSITRYFKMGGLLPDLDIDNIDNFIRPNGSTDHTITIGSATNTTTYEVRLGSSSGTVIATAPSSDPNGVLTVNNIPPAGSSRTYYVTGRRSLANGGSDTVSLILSYTVTHESPGSSVGDGGTSSYGLQVFDANGDTVLDVSDRVVVFSDYVTGSLSSTELTKTVTLAKQGTVVIDMEPATVVISNGLAQRQDILHTTISGNTLTIERVSTTPGFYYGPNDGAGQSTTYKFLVLYDPEAS